MGVDEMNGEAEPGKGEVAPKQSEGARAAELLMGLAGGARVFRAADGRFHARVPVNGREAIFRLKSSSFRDWLVDGYVSAYQKLPPKRAIQRVLEALEARARFETAGPPVYVRVGRDQDESRSNWYLDLGDHAGTAIKICASGWSIVEKPSVHFAQPQGQLPLPVPCQGGSIELLRGFVNLTESDFHLLIGWLAYSLRPEGPYPVLILYGNQASAKTTLVKVIRKLIDPQTGSVLGDRGVPAI
jgi:hypothetical protein